MKRLFPVLVFFLFISAPAMAGFGISNVVTGEIHRETAPAMPSQGQGCAKTAFYPFTIHLSSWQTPEDALRERDRLLKSLGNIFITKIDLGKAGVWYRVDHGVFPSIKDAVENLRKLQKEGYIDKGAFVGGQVPYTIEVALVNDKRTAAKETKRLDGLGIVTYTIEESDNCFRLLVGAYPDETSARLLLADIRAIGMKARITRR